MQTESLNKSIMRSSLYKGRRTEEDEELDGPLDPSTVYGRGSGPASVRGEEEEYEEYQDEDEDEIARKALVQIAANIITKYSRDPSASRAMVKEFDDVISSVFRPHGGSDNATNLRSPGQPEGKVQARIPGPSGANYPPRRGAGRSTYPSDDFGSRGHLMAEDWFDGVERGPGHTSGPATVSQLREGSRASRGSSGIYDETAETYQHQALYGVNDPGDARTFYRPMPRDLRVNQVPTKKGRVGTILAAGLLKSFSGPNDESRQRGLAAAMGREIDESEEDEDFGLSGNPAVQTEELEEDDEDIQRRRFREKEAEAQRLIQLSEEFGRDESERQRLRENAMDLREAASDELRFEGKITRPPRKKSLTVDARVAGSRGNWFNVR